MAQPNSSELARCGVCGTERAVTIMRSFPSGDVIGTQDPGCSVCAGNTAKFENIAPKNDISDDQIIKLQAMQLVTLRAQLVEGMPSLRDQFAMAALTGIWADPKVDPTDNEDFEHLARSCYKMADAMLEARKK